MVAQFVVGECKRFDMERESQLAKPAKTTAMDDGLIKFSSYQMLKR
jgi:hypothetical protein